MGGGGEIEKKVNAFYIITLTFASDWLASWIWSLIGHAYVLAKALITLSVQPGLLFVCLVHRLMNSQRSRAAAAAAAADDEKDNYLVISLITIMALAYFAIGKSHHQVATIWRAIFRR